MRKEEIIEYIKSDPARLDAYRAKTPEDRASFLDRFITEDLTAQEPAQKEKKDIFTPTQREQETRPVLSAGAMGLGVDPRVTGEEIAIAGMEGINMAGYGIPSYLLGKAGMQIPDPTTTVGGGLKAVGQAAGLMASPATKVISRVATKLTAPIIPRVTGFGSGIGGGAIKGAVEGGMIGFALTPEDNILDMNARALQASAGGALGGLLGAIGGAAKGYQAYKAKQLSGGLPEQLKQEKITSSKKVGKLESKKKIVKAAEKKLIDRLTEKQSQLKDNLDKNLTAAAREDAKEIQKIVYKMKGDISRTYNQKLDLAEDRIVASRGGEKLKNNEIADVFNETISEADVMRLDRGTVYAKLKNVADKFNIKIETVNSGILDAQGNPIASFRVEKPRDVDLRDAIAAIRNVTSGESSAVYSATRSAKAEDIPSFLLRKNWGKFIEQFDSTLPELNREYGATMKEFKPILTLTKPYGSDTELAGIRNAIERVAKNPGKNPEAADLLGRIEDGFGLAEGAGKITQKTRAAKNLIDIEMAKAENVKSSYSRLAKSKKLQIDKAIRDELEAIGVRENAINKLMREEKFKSAISIAAGIGSSVAAAIPYAIKRWETGKLLKLASGGGSTAGE